MKKILIVALILIATMATAWARALFDTREEAIQKGYRPCGNCRP